VNRYLLQIPIYIFGLIFIISLLIAPYNMYKQDLSTYNTQQDRLDILSRKVIVLQRAGAIPITSITSTVINSQNILLADYAGINNRILNNCSIFGSPTIIYFNNCTITKCTMDKQTASFVVYSEDALKNSNSTIIFDDCVFDTCDFHDITIIGNQTQIDSYKTQIIRK